MIDWTLHKGDSKNGD